MEFPQPFSSITGFRELRDGKILVADFRDGALQILDPRAKSATRVSRKGSGPNEYQRIGRLLALGLDTTAMYDSGNARLLLLGADGFPVNTLPVGSRVMDLLSAATWGDSHGSLYARLLTGFRDPQTLADTTLVARYNVATGKIDTVATVHVSKTDVNVTTRADGSASVLSAAVPFAVHDDWVALSDGRLAIAVGKDYHIDFRDRASTFSGPRTPFAPIPVTDADKDSVRAARRPKSSGEPGSLQPVSEPSVWYATKAPFVENGAWPGANGQLWIQVNRRGGDSGQQFDGFDRTGHRWTSIVLPAGSRVVGFGSQSVYASRKDADDQQFIQRFDFPR